jgi:hypothetical protein
VDLVEPAGAEVLLSNVGSSDGDRPLVSNGAGLARALSMPSVTTVPPVPKSPAPASPSGLPGPSLGPAMKPSSDIVSPATTLPIGAPSLVGVGQVRVVPNSVSATEPR